MALYRSKIGIFRGFGESHREIVGELLLPFSPRMPLQGGFLVIAVEDFQGREAGVLGRLVRAFPVGDLNTPPGEEYLMDLLRLEMEIPEEVMRGRLRYRVSMKMLGQLTRQDDGSVQLTPAVRIMPHLGAGVGVPGDEVMRLIARGSSDPVARGAHIGHLSVGDLAFDGSAGALGRNYPVEFRMDSLVGRRTAVFARAGMGKSNFVKVLLARLYESDPGVGTLVFDPEGEYSFANASEPGLLDVPGLQDRVVVFTDRQDIDGKYARCVAGNTRIDLSALRAEDAVANLLPPEKQETVFANTLRTLNDSQWKQIVTLLAKDGFRASQAELGKICARQMKYAESRQGGQSGDVVLAAIANNLVPPIQRLHSSSSNLIAKAIAELRAGKIVILDLSMLSGADSRTIAALLLRSIFSINQQAFTGRRDGGAAAPAMVPTLAVLEEAQFYLGDASVREDSPFVRWFKEGRKFQLGSILVTQQPGAIGHELISQCDNFFVFHLLSRHDLNAMAMANIHYDGDVATAIGQEPIPGNCFFWSSRGLSFVTCARIIHFGSMVEEVRASPLEVAGKAVAAVSPVILPVEELRAPAGGEEAALRAAFSHAVCSDPKVHLLKIRGVRPAAPFEVQGCFAVSIHFATLSMLSHLDQLAVDRRIDAGMAAKVRAESTTPRFITRLESLLLAEGCCPDVAGHKSAPGIGPVFVLYYSRFDLGRKTGPMRVVDIEMGG
jgi:hypothetical protein